MGSIAAGGFSFANLLQNLTSASPQVSSALSTSAVQTALQNAPASDLVELSDQALQLQETSQLFANSGATDIAALPPSLDPTAAFSADSSSPASSSTASLANQLGGYQSDLQSNEMQTLFEVTPAGPSLSSLFNVLG